MISKIITTVKVRDVVDGIWRERIEYYGKSTDEKPIEGAQNADIFYEMDTQKVYLFDEEAQVWLEQ